jgi:Na+/proline symporter
LIKTKPNRDFFIAIVAICSYKTEIVIIRIVEMSFNIDAAIIIVFLVINLVVGIYSGKNIKTIKEYAVGNRNFSTATIAATIIATWISGSDFAVAISETYKEGLWYLVAGAGDIFALLIIAHIFGPRMKEFFGDLSVAESMGNMYGKKLE